MLDKFGMLNSKHVTTPLALHFKLSKIQATQTEEDWEYMGNVPYANTVGSLMYGMICSRPDLAHGVSVINRFMGNPGREHWEATKWIMRYLKWTEHFALLYDGSKQYEEAVVGSMQVI